MRRSFVVLIRVSAYTNHGGACQDGILLLISSETSRGIGVAQSRRRLGWVSLRHECASIHDPHRVRERVVRIRPLLGEPEVVYYYDVITRQRLPRTSMRSSLCDSYSYSPTLWRGPYDGSLYGENTLSGVQMMSVTVGGRRSLGGANPSTLSCEGFPVYAGTRLRGCT